MNRARVEAPCAEHGRSSCLSCAEHRAWDAGDRLRHRAIAIAIAAAVGLFLARIVDADLRGTIDATLFAIALQQGWAITSPRLGFMVLSVPIVIAYGIVRITAAVAVGWLWPIFAIVDVVRYAGARRQLLALEANARGQQAVDEAIDIVRAAASPAA